MGGRDKTVVIGLSSLPGGGKDYVADILVEDYGFYKISPGDITRELLKQASKSVTMTREIQEQLTKDLIKKYGQNYLMELCYKKIRKSKKGRIVIPGLRYASDVDFYRERFDGSFTNIFIYASKKTRYSRLASRNRGDMPSSYAEFNKQDEAQEKRYRLQKTKDISDYKMYNDHKNKRQIRSELEKILEKFS